MLRQKTRGYAVKIGISRTFSLACKKYRMEYMEGTGSAGKRLAGREMARRQSGAAALRRIARITYGAIRCAIDALRVTALRLRRSRLHESGFASINYECGTHVFRLKKYVSNIPHDMIAQSIASS